MSLTIRIATMDDLPLMISLLDELFSIEEDFVGDPLKQEKGLALLLEDPKSCILVAEKNQQVVGMVTAQLVISTAEGALSGLIEDMIVTQNFRGQSIGSALLAAIEEWCFSNGATRIQLLADKNNTPALEFYRKKNWQSTQLICYRKLQ